MTRADLTEIAALLNRDLRTAGDRYRAVVQGSRDPDIAIQVEGTTTMWFHLSQADDWLDHLASVIHQAADVVIEDSTEPWPECPDHRHPLIPRPRGGRVVWECMTEDRGVADLGSLTDVLTG
jgi:hypothetical protein